MLLSVRYRTKASECALKALDEQNTEECERFLRMAGHWIVVAKNEEWLVNNSLVGPPNKQPKRSGLIGNDE